LAQPQPNVLSVFLSCWVGNPYLMGNKWYMKIISMYARITALVILSINMVQYY